MFNERLGHAILHAPRGIRRLQFRYYASGPRGYYSAEFDQGCVADRIEKLWACHRYLINRVVVRGLTTCASAEALTPRKQQALVRRHSRMPSDTQPGPCTRACGCRTPQTQMSPSRGASRSSG